MKTDVRFPDRWSRCLTAAVAIASIIIPSMMWAEGGVVDQSVDALYNLHDQLQQVVMKSVKGVGEAMQEGPQQQGDRPWSMDDLKQIRQKNADLVNQNAALADAQQRLANLNAQLLSKLPPNDPRRAALSNELKQVASQMPDTRQAIQNYTNKLAESNAAIDRWNQRTDPAYIPPKKPITVRAKPPEPVEQPNTDDNSGGGGGDNTDNGVDGLRRREAEKEAEARALGKQREAAVNKYLDDPSADNHAEAEAIKARLDGMVDDLNQLRGQVDGIDGVSRPPIHVKSAKAIAKARRQRLEGGTPTDTSGTNQGSGGGGGCGMATGQGENHNPDGSDASGGYQDVGPGGGGGNGNAGSGGGGRHHGRRSASHSGGGGRNGGGGDQTGVTSSGQYQRSAAGKRGKKQSNAASNQNHQNHQGHHQNGGGGRSSNQQTVQQQKQYHPHQQNMVQNNNQQQQRKKRAR